MTATKERPVIMTGESVRAILDGRKTQTRRVVKPQPDSPCVLAPDIAWIAGRATCIWPAPYVLDDGSRPDHHATCRHGKPGDRLWVKETWALVKPQYDHEFPNYVDGFEEWAGPIPMRCPPGWTLILKSLWNGYEYETAEERGFSWRPSLFMPRWASRLTLEITEVRVQRLHEITEEDAKAEGVEWNSGPLRMGHTHPISAFKASWDEINGKKRPWSSNPWIWAISFRKVEPEGDTP